MLRFVWQIVVALVVAGLASGALYYFLARNPQAADSSALEQKVKQAAKDVEKVVNQAREAAQGAQELGKAVNKAKEVVTRVPMMYHQATQALGGGGADTHDGTGSGAR